MQKVRIGFIKYANSLPFYYDPDGVAFEKAAADACGGAAEIEVFYGHPARLNEMITAGELDMAAISSYAYVQNRDRLQMMNKISISAYASVMSVLLISSVPMSGLSGREILVSDESASSTSLLKILAEEFFDNSRVRYTAARTGANGIDETIGSGRAAAVMAIGDEALKYYERRRVTAAPASAALAAEDGAPLVFDLCSLWNGFTSLPFVFAIMAAKKDFYFANKKICDAVSETVKGRIRRFTADRAPFAKKAAELTTVGVETMEKYYALLNYEFMPEHIMALEEYEKRLKKLETPRPIDARA